MSYFSTRCHDTDHLFVFENLLLRRSPKKAFDKWMERLSWFTSERCSNRHHVTTIASHSCSTPLIKLHFSRLRFRSMTRSVMRLSAIRQLALACWKSAFVVLIFPRFCGGVGGNETISDYLSEWNEEKTKKKGHKFPNQKKAENWIILFSCAALSTHRHQQQKREKFFPSQSSSERFFVSEFNQFSRVFFSCAWSSEKNAKKLRVNERIVECCNFADERSERKKNNSRSFKVTL